MHTFENFKHSFLRNGKPIFVPNEFGEELGRKLKRKVAKAYKFDPFIYHFKDGSHVKALHLHRKNTFFCRVDIEKFFYGIRRNRVKRVLKEINVPKPEYYAKWSTVKNPYDGGGYVVPYGFVQSPILATLALALSPVGIFLRGLPEAISPSVYMDDICLSSQDKDALGKAFDGLLEAMEAGNFKINADKTREPAPAIDIFNCSLANGVTTVLPERVEEFFAVDHEPASIEAFEAYCDIVKSHTWRVGGKRKRRRLVRVTAKSKA